MGPEEAGVRGSSATFRPEVGTGLVLRVEALVANHLLPGPNKAVATAFGAVLIGVMGRGWAIPAAGVDRIAPVEMEMTVAGAAYRAVDGDTINTHRM